MKKIKQKIVDALSKIQNKPLLRLFLTGIHGQMQKLNYPKPYNFYINIISIIGTFYFAKSLLELKKPEMERKGINWLIPDYIYKVREESYIYWQIVRLAKGLPTTYTFYKWDDNLMYQIDRKGNQIPFHTHRAIEDPRTFISPLHQYLFPANPQTHSTIMMYLKNINNPYDLYNHLRFKWVNIGDWIRAGYYLIYRQLGLTNRWRYDQFLTKPDIYYRWQKIKLGFLISKNRKILYQKLDTMKLTKAECIKFIFWPFQIVEIPQ